MQWLRLRVRPGFLLVALVAAAGVALVAPPADSIDWGDGEWTVTSYSLHTPNNCDAAAGEVCKEWCLMSNGSLVPTGDLCCVIDDDVCLVRNFRP